MKQPLKRKDGRGRPPKAPEDVYGAVGNFRAPLRLLDRAEALFRKANGALEYNQSAFIRLLLEEAVSAREER
jgi:hypothetical protein